MKPSNEVIDGWIRDRAKGERVRVLFDLLMETINADLHIKQHEVFERIKVMIEKEGEAIKEMMAHIPSRTMEPEVFDNQILDE